MTISSEQKNLINQTLQMHDLFLQHGDEERAEKAVQLGKKIYKGEWIIAFCGHFSAGKSTMINALTGEELLPSSPIPTSANLVKIKKSKKEYTKIYYHHRTPVTIQGEFDSHRVKQLCKSGDTVDMIEIGHRESKIPAGVTVLDTPGVDSTDAAHMLATESTLHLADLIFYVVDYNHVQSQVNFQYTKELIDKGASIHLIVNQVDKHNEEEISFAQFQASVASSFASWDVNLSAIYYTSLKNPQHEENQFPALQQFLLEELQDRFDSMSGTAEVSMNHLLAEHIQWLEEQYDENVQVYVERLTHKDWEKKEKILKDYELWKEVNSGAWLKKWEDDFNQERNKILQNAYIMPYENRHLAEHYLTSTQKEFKVGLFFAKGKTEEERNRRFIAFQEALRGTVVSQLDWHVKNFLLEKVKNLKISDGSIQGRIDSFHVDVTYEMIQQAESHGAKISGEYVLHYCKTMTDIITKVAERQANDIKELLLKHLQKNPLVAISEEARHKAEAFQGIQFEKEQLQNQKESLTLQLESDNFGFQDSALIIENWLEEEKGEEVQKDSILKNEQEITKKEDSLVDQWQRTSSKDQNLDVQGTIDRLVSMSQQFITIPGLESFAQNLREKAKRLDERHFTVALFGAFSAGKSSFANALLGTKALPVSPNPTTATINRIQPSQHNKRDMAIIHLKSPEVMLKDLNHSLSFFQRKVNSVQEAYDKISSIKRNELSGVENTHLAFLHAFQKGFSLLKSKLGESLTVSLAEYEGYAANEHQACFVDVIDVHLDNDFTNQGITLVDTPGADSINARHTDVAFQYIKDADVILFVTYYNHAFSKADREFLIQLGRVKDSFEMDKMFFIVNAIDLASSEEEETEVMNYVESQLLQYGIRSPQLFGLSSQQSLKEKLDFIELNKKMQRFQVEFDSYLLNGLTKMVVDSANFLLDKGKNRLSHLIQGNKKTVADYETYIHQIQNQSHLVLDLLTNESIQSIYPVLQQEIDELLLYVHQRVFFRYSDFFKEAFFPSLFNKHDSQTALSLALSEVLDSTAYDVLQELRATTVRLEKFMKKQLSEKANLVSTHLNDINGDLVFFPTEWSNIQTPPFSDIKDDFLSQSYESPLKLFKNTKRFFEQNEKELVKESLADSLKPIVKTYLQSMSGLLFNWSKEYVDGQFSIFLDSTEKEARDQFHSWTQGSSTEQDIQRWESVYRKVTEADHVQ
ncbi:dynamin family protein [Bacillus sp. 2205SS5-2]|uniref:dynamin family protein n=1 Tax=Bacillus sp. 2205SS5-2 TaxID=3109031 RepID=UPI00300651AD